MLVGMVSENQKGTPEIETTGTAIIAGGVSSMEGGDLSGPAIAGATGRRFGTRLFSRLKHIVGLDRAIAFTVLARGWSIFSGVLTVLLIARFLSPVEQGYYYTFSSLVAMQVVFELGFSFVILQLAAHESARLQILEGERISGDAVAHSRLASVLKKSIRWYSVAACLMGTALLAVGFWFFLNHKQSTSSLSWRIPWVCLVGGVVFTFQMDPVFSFLEGCGFVAQVARMRLTQAISGTVLAWIALTHHSGLFAPAGVVAGQAVASCPRTPPIPPARRHRGWGERRKPRERRACALAENPVRGPRPPACRRPARR